MALILRVDVDKPYGHSNLIRKVASKVSEDYFKIPLFSGISYLSHFIRFLEYCNANGVPGFMYHRMCTIPDQHVNELLKAGGHQLGFHAENTRTSATFAAELKRFRQQTSLPVNSFTKHGSGTLKLGKHHYPPYEPGKYKVWAQQEGIGYYFGNGICTSAADLFAVNGFFENMFW
ncbi:MAG TPA: hypothetical protein VNZ86_09275, partial [Bacteroidia bacterium]|nr:hypothetical protein [Bacteroidia bacterium]